jgi:hypothetical protein
VPQASEAALALREAALALPEAVLALREAVRAVRAVREAALAVGSVAAVELVGAKLAAPEPEPYFPWVVSSHSAGGYSAGREVRLLRLR